MKVLVTGATGKVGSALLPCLLQAGHETRALTRAPYKLKKMADRVEIAEGSLADPATLGAAMKDIEAVVLITPVAPNETEQGLNGVAAAVEAGVRRIVSMTVYGAEEAAQIPHFGSKVPIKEAVVTSGLDYVFLEPNNFFQNDLWIEDPLRLFGIYPQPLGGIGLYRVDVRDIADAAVNALAGAAHDGQTFPLVGPERLTGEDCAAVWSKHLGTDVQYVGDNLDNWEKQAELLMPPWMAHDLRLMYEHFQQHGLLASAEEMAACEKIVGHPARRFEEFVAETAGAWR